jgi:D-amino peptidase
MKVYMMTDQEGAAGVLDFQNFGMPGSYHYELARRLVTGEVNAAVDGLFEGGATEILVVDGHGSGTLDLELLDPRVEYLRGWGEGPYPLCLDASFDAAVWLCQHAKAGTEYGHLAHTGSAVVLDFCINGVSVGEFGQVAMCASELGVRTIFATGDAAFAREAQALVPGLETVAVKSGVKPGTGDELTEEQYSLLTSSARHVQPARARRLIREGAVRAIQRARAEDFGIIPLRAPFEKVVTLRANAERPHKTISRVTHPTSVAAVMNLGAPQEPLDQ